MFVVKQFDLSVVFWGGVLVKRLNGALPGLEDKLRL